MCQKAFGSFFAPLAGVAYDKFELTRGELAIFKSSDFAERGFCRDCGTPLTFGYVDHKRVAISIGSLDEPQLCEPRKQFGIEARMSWFAALPGLAGTTTEEDSGAWAAKIAASNRQHPDHDTAEWPPRA
jgi:hypothetical protein